MIAPGSKVGCQRWPYAGAHPDCWGKPWKGTVLSVLDPRSWEGRAAFPSGARPSREAVAAHCARHAISDSGDRVPVLWDFGADGTRVYWEHADKLRPYSEDLEAWNLARWEARQDRKVA